MKGSKLQLELIKVVLLITLCSSLVTGGVTGRVRRHHGKHLIIHVPMKIRTHHHTHTVFTQMQGKGGGERGAGGDNSGKATKQTIYKIMGYSTHHTSAGSGEVRGVGGGAGGAGGGVGSIRGGGRGYGHGHGYAPHTFRQGHRNGGGGGYGEINYDDYTNTNCDNSLAHGDMIFNHYSRHDEDYPDVEEEEELIEEDDRIHDEWERL